MAGSELTTAPEIGNGCDILPGLKTLTSSEGDKQGNRYIVIKLKSILYMFMFMTIFLSHGLWDTPLS